MSNFEKFNGEFSWKEKFDSLLTGKTVSCHEDDHIIKIWNKFEMKTIKDYHDLYLICDVLVLADIFEKFRNNNLKNSGLCPSHYLGAPALNADAMFNMTKIKVELISDPDMCIFLEKGMRGGVCLFLVDVVKPLINI